MVDKIIVTRMYELDVDSDTGAVISSRLVGETSDNSDKIQLQALGPVAVLEDKKISFTKEALEMMGVSAGDKLELQYEAYNGGTRPVIGLNTAFGIGGGNILSASGTIACRGRKREELAKFGTVFEIAPHPAKDGIFILGTEDKARESADMIEDPDLSLEGLTEDEPITDNIYQL